MENQKEFNLIFSIGEACDTSYHLRRCMLQTESLPFDWTLNYSGLSIIRCFENNFKDFFLKDNLKFERKAKNLTVFCDRKYDLSYMHDFSDENIDEEYQAVYEKYLRRIKRLTNKIKKAEKILIVFHCEKEKDINEINNFINRFNGIYKKNAQILYLISDNNYLKPQITYKDSNITIFRFLNNRTENWKGNEENWSLILKNYKLCET